MAGAFRYATGESTSFAPLINEQLGGRRMLERCLLLSIVSQQAFFITTIAFISL
jgi:hypothetical protein